MKSRRRILVVFKTHLDLGYTDSAARVARRYFDVFIPRALATAAALRERGGDRFVWTTGSWLVHAFLERAGRTGRRAMERAIAAGDLAWHALPFTFETDLLDAGLWEEALSLAAELNARFGRRTVAAKLTDVPGCTRAALPFFARAGVRFLHVGVNPATPVPDVPPVFRWRGPGGAEVIAAFSRDYGQRVAVPGLTTELHFAHTGDNHGPQEPAQVAAFFTAVRTANPDAEVAAGTLDEFARELATVRARLPVVTQEIGDTWVHGVASDPQKVARYRALSAWRADALRRRPEWAADERWRRFSRGLLFVPEHTWGRDTKVVIRRERGPWRIFHPGRWTPAGFTEDRRRGVFKRYEASWREQRAYLTAAVAELGRGERGAAARAVVRSCAPRLPRRGAAAQRVAIGQRVRVAGHEVEFASNGALVHWRTERGELLADAAHPLGVMRYQLFSGADVTAWYRDYAVNQTQTATWAEPDFTKFGCPGRRRGEWMWRVAEAWTRENELVAKLVAGAAWVRGTGCPAEVWLMWTFGPAGARLVVQWLDKPACRLPEAVWLSFAPRVSRAQAWRLVKAGEEIDPRDVVRRGAQRLHAVEALAHPALRVELKHAPLVSVGERALLKVPRGAADPRGGWHVCLANNVWGTNFPQWIEGGVRCEFAFHSAGERAP